MNIDKFMLLKHLEILQLSDLSCNDNTDEINKINFIYYNDINNQKDDTEIQLIGIVNSIKKGITKKGKFFGIITISFNNEELEQFMYESQILKLFKLNLNIPILFNMKTKNEELGIGMRIIDLKSTIKNKGRK